MMKEYLNDFGVLSSEDLIVNENKEYEPYRKMMNEHYLVLNVGLMVHFNCS